MRAITHVMPKAGESNHTRTRAQCTHIPLISNASHASPHPHECQLLLLAELPHAPRPRAAQQRVAAEAGQLLGAHATVAHGRDLRAALRGGTWGW